MKRILFVTLLVVVAWASAGCGAINTLTGGDQNMRTVSQLWSDVPRMDGMTSSQQVDMPAELKVLARPIMDGMMRGLNDGTEAGHWDWTGFALSSKTPGDVQAFYTPERMAGYGWKSEGGCMDSSAMTGGVNPGGGQFIFCAFQKQEGSKTTGLLIIAASDEAHKATSVFFMRQEAEGSATPNARLSTPAAPSSGNVPGGPAPYGIDQRPMPGGLALDPLLPKQVGPYTRVRLELSTNRSVQPSTIEMDGASVYATYRAGANEIFVELGVSSSAEAAQEALQVAAGDAAGGVFPTDPRFGSLGTEPSYLKVVNADGAFFAWTRGGYYFSADAKGGETALDAFMQAFPY